MPNLQEWLLLGQSVCLLMLAWMLVAANRQALRLRSDIDSLLWLARKLMGKLPQPSSIELESEGVKCAKPGDLVILHYAKKVTPEGRRELCEYLAMLREKHPDVRFLMLDDAWRPVFVATGVTHA